MVHIEVQRRGWAGGCGEAHVCLWMLDLYLWLSRASIEGFLELLKLLFEDSEHAFFSERFRKDVVHTY